MIKNTGNIIFAIQQLEKRFERMQNHIKQNKKDKKCLHRLFRIKDRIMKMQNYKVLWLKKNNL